MRLNNRFVSLRNTKTNSNINKPFGDCWARAQIFIVMVNVETPKKIISTYPNANKDNQMI